ncbi:MAG: cobalamin-dependent protein [Candidatus Marinimicrobia bacterium]|nr:cobalamin-dependent protein [Candidatus Neomarinimicrobiota bacterium]
MQKTADNAAMISSIDVAKILGVNVATIKRWTDSGKLDCVKTAGGHRKFLLRHLAAFAMEHEKYSQRLSLLPIDNREDLELSEQILHADYGRLIPQTLELSLNCNQESLNTILSGLYMIHQDLASIYEDLLTPVLRVIGEKWMDGKISVSQEHLASQTIRDGIVKLQNVVVKPEILKGKAFVLTLSEELHDIPAKMVQHLLELRGYQVLYSGQKTPAEDTVSVFESFHPDRVYLSSIYAENISDAQSELKELIKLCADHKIDLYVGGSGLDQLGIHEDKNITVLNSLRAVFNS